METPPPCNYAIVIGERRQFCPRSARKFGGRGHYAGACRRYPTPGSVKISAGITAAPAPAMSPASSGESPSSETRCSRHHSTAELRDICLHIGNRSADACPDRIGLDGHALRDGDRRGGIDHALARWTAADKGLAAPIVRDALRTRDQHRAAETAGATVEHDLTILLRGTARLDYTRGVDDIIDDV